MSNTVDISFVNSYHNKFDYIFQQEGSKLRNTLTNVTQHSEFDYFDRLGTAEVQEIAGRHTDTPFNEIEHTRRRNQIIGYDTNEFFDNQDKLRMIADPRDGYARAQAWAIGRKQDDAIINALLGTAYSGKAGATSVTFDSDFIVAVDFAEGGGGSASGLTIGKLRQARYLLENSDAIMEGELVHLVGHPKQKQQLLASTETTSSDFNTVKALVDGQLNEFMGFKFIWTTRAQLNASSYRQVLVYPQSAGVLGTAQETTVRIDERPDKRYSWQVYTAATFGATRLWEERVVSILCSEA